MSAVDKLISYILELKPEQVEKVLQHLPRFVALLEESSGAKEGYILSITNALYQTNDIALLDLIDKLLRKSV